MTLPRITSSTTQALDFKGTHVRIRMSANDNADTISVIEHHLPPGEAPPLHIHKNEDEVFHVLSGRMRFEVGGKEIRARAGDVVMAPKGVALRFIVESAEGAHCMTVTTGRDFEAMIREASAPAQGGMPARAAAPSEAEIVTLVEICARNNIDIIGPPLAA